MKTIDIGRAIGVLYGTTNDFPVTRGNGFDSRHLHKPLVFELLLRKKQVERCLEHYIGDCAVANVDAFDHGFVESSSSVIRRLPVGLAAFAGKDHRLVENLLPRQRLGVE